MNNQDWPLPGDQTKFADQAVLFQDQIPLDKPNLKSDQKPHSKKLLIVVALGAILLAGLIMVVVSSRRNGQQQGSAPSPEPFDQDRNLTPIQARLNEVRDDLELADPSDDLLPFPPLTGGIRIIDKKR